MAKEYNAHSTFDRAVNIATGALVSLRLNHNLPTPTFPDERAPFAEALRGKIAATAEVVADLMAEVSDLYGYSGNGLDCSKRDLADELLAVIMETIEDHAPTPAEIREENYTPASLNAARKVI